MLSCTFLLNIWFQTIKHYAFWQKWIYETPNLHSIELLWQAPCRKNSDKHNNVFYRFQLLWSLWRAIDKRNIYEIQKRHNTKAFQQDYRRNDRKKQAIFQKGTPLPHGASQILPEAASKHNVFKKEKEYYKPQHKKSDYKKCNQYPEICKQRSSIHEYRIQSWNKLWQCILQRFKIFV